MKKGDANFALIFLFFGSSAILNCFLQTAKGNFKL